MGAVGRFCGGGCGAKYTPKWSLKFAISGSYFVNLSLKMDVKCNFGGRHLGRPLESERCAVTD